MRAAPSPGLLASNAMLRDLKIRTRDLDAVLDGRATIQIGAGDADIEVDDRLRLREWDPDEERYLDREHVVLVIGIEERSDGDTVLAVRDEPAEMEGPVS